MQKFYELHVISIHFSDFLRKWLTAFLRNTSEKPMVEAMGAIFLWLHGAGARGFSGLSKVAHNLVGAAPSNSWMDALLLPQPGGAVPDTPS